MFLETPMFGMFLPNKNGTTTWWTKLNQLLTHPIVIAGGLRLQPTNFEWGIVVLETLPRDPGMVP